MSNQVISESAFLENSDITTNIEVTKYLFEYLNSSVLQSDGTIGTTTRRQELKIIFNGSIRRLPTNVNKK